MRVVRNLQTLSTTTAPRTPVDSYARPFYHDNQRLNSISASLEKWLPTFVNYQKNEDDRKYRKEVADGYALAAKYAGEDPSVEGFRQMVADGRAEGMRSLSKAHEHGINTFQMEAAMNKLNTQMQEWWDNSTFIDETGKERRISEVQDPAEFDRQYNKAISSTWEQLTGGQYDSQLYKQAFQQTAGAIHNIINQKFLAKRAEAKKFETDNGATAAMDSVLAPALGSKMLYLEPQKFDALITDRMNHNLDIHASTSSTAEAAQWGVDYYVANIINKNPTEIQRLLQSAKGVRRIWDNPKHRLAIESAVKTARYNWDMEERNRQYKYAKAKNDAAEQAYDRVVKELYQGNHSKVDLKILDDPRINSSRETYNLAQNQLRYGSVNSPSFQRDVRAAYMGLLTREQVEEQYSLGRYDTREHMQLLDTIEKSPYKNPDAARNVLKTLPIMQTLGANEKITADTKALAEGFLLDAALEHFKESHPDPSQPIDYKSPQVQKELADAAAYVSQSYGDNILTIAEQALSQKRGIEIKDPKTATDFITKSGLTQDEQFRGILAEWRNYIDLYKNQRFNNGKEIIRYAPMGPTIYKTVPVIQLENALQSKNLIYDNIPIRTMEQLYAIVADSYLFVLENRKKEEGEKNSSTIQRINENVANFASGS